MSLRFGVALHRQAEAWQCGGVNAPQTEACRRKPANGGQKTEFGGRYDKTRFFVRRISMLLCIGIYDGLRMTTKNGQFDCLNRSDGACFFGVFGPNLCDYREHPAGLCTGCLVRVGYSGVPLAIFTAQLSANLFQAHLVCYA